MCILWDWQSAWFLDPEHVEITIAFVSPCTSVQVYLPALLSSLDHKCFGERDRETERQRERGEREKTRDKDKKGRADKAFLKIQTIMCHDQTSYVQHTAGNEWTLFTVSNLDSQFCQAFKQLSGYLGFIMYSYFT